MSKTIKNKNSKAAKVLVQQYQIDQFSDTTCANLTSALGRSTAERAARPNGHSFDPFLERVEKDANVQKALRKEGL